MKNIEKGEESMWVNLVLYQQRAEKILTLSHLLYNF